MPVKNQKETADEFSLPISDTTIKRLYPYLLVLGFVLVFGVIDGLVVACAILFFNYSYARWKNRKKKAK